MKKSNLSQKTKDILSVAGFTVATVIFLTAVFMCGYNAGSRSAEQTNRHIQTLEKPVVYFYPKEDNTQISYTTRASKDFAVSYPKYDKGWHFTANTDGTITYDNRQFNYLYWEAQSERFISNIKTNDGWILSSDEVVPFLEEKLTFLGLNNKERADFISYWLPKLTRKQYVYIKFANDEFEEYASPIVKPRPDEHIYVYMLCESLDSNDYDVKPQRLFPKQRKGFTVVEWGGTDLTHE